MKNVNKLETMFTFYYFNNSYKLLKNKKKKKKVKSGRFNSKC